MRTPSLYLAALATFASAQQLGAQAQPPAAAQVADTVIRAGTYELSVTFGGGVLEATLQIDYVGDTLTAVLKLGDHNSPVKAGQRRGNRLALVPTSPSMDVRYDLEFKGDVVSGTFRYQGQEGAVTGRRRAARN